MSEAKHTPGPLWKVPVHERIERIQRRLSRRVYHQTYGSDGHDLFDVVRFAADLGVSCRELYKQGFVKNRNDYGWNLPFAPDAKTMKRIETWLVRKERKVVRR